MVNILLVALLFIVMSCPPCKLVGNFTTGVSFSRCRTERVFLSMVAGYPTLEFCIERSKTKLCLFESLLFRGNILLQFVLTLGICRLLLEPMPVSSIPLYSAPRTMCKVGLFVWMNTGFNGVCNIQFDFLVNLFSSRVGYKTSIL